MVLGNIKSNEVSMKVKDIIIYTTDSINLLGININK